MGQASKLIHSTRLNRGCATVIAALFLIASLPGSAGAETKPNVPQKSAADPGSAKSKPAEQKSATAKPSEEKAPGIATKTITPASSGSVQLLDMVLASIEDEPITISDLREFAEQQGKPLPENLLNGDPIVRQALRELVVTKLIEREAAASGISVSDEEVKAYVEEIKRQNHVDDQGLSQLLASKGLSAEVYKRQVREDIFKTRVVGSHVRNKITVTDEEVQRRMSGGSSSESGDESSGEVEQKKGVRLFQIRLQKAEGDLGEAKAEAEKMREQLESGENWPKVGSDRFTDLGTVDVSDLRPELGEAVEDLDENEVSKPVETADAVYLLMKASADKAKLSSTDTVEDRVRQDLYQEKFSAALDKFLNEDLPKKYHVELKL